MIDDHTVTVVGSGYVGTTTAALLAAVGIKTYALDIDKAKVDKLLAGKAPFYEAGLDDLVAHGVNSGVLIPTQSYEDSIPKSDIVISAVGTPDNPDGSPNLKYVFMALESIAHNTNNPIIYVQKSTVPVGTGRQIIAKFKELSDQEFHYVSAPEFLREATAVVDSIEPDRIVVGGNDEASKKVIADIFVHIADKRQQIADIAKQPIENLPAPAIHDMELESAELTKVTANAFLALKISFANSIAKLADVTDANIIEVMDAVGADARIGRAFLNAGRGYGGGCFPKDVKGLISSAQTHGVGMEIMQAASELNAAMPNYIVERLKQQAGNVDGKKVAVLGLAFKAGTSDVRKSPGIKIANLLSDQGALVSAFDPEANEEAKADLNQEIKLVDSMKDALAEAEIVIVATEWAEFKKLNLPSTVKVIFDAMNLNHPSEFDKPITYIGIGRSR